MKKIVLALSLFALSIHPTHAQLSKDCIETTDSKNSPKGIRTFLCKVTTSTSSTPVEEMKTLKTLLQEKKEEVASYVTSYVYSNTVSAIKESEGKHLETFESKSGSLLLEDISHEVNKKSDAKFNHYEFSFKVDESIVRKKMDQLVNSITAEYASTVLQKLQNQVASCNQQAATDPSNFDACKLQHQIAFQKNDAFMKSNYDKMAIVAQALDRAQSKLIQASEDFKKRRLIGNDEKIVVGGKTTSMANLIAFVRHVEGLLLNAKTDLDRTTIKKLHNLEETTPYGLNYKNAKDALFDWSVSYFRKLNDVGMNFDTVFLYIKGMDHQHSLQSDVDFNKACICVPVEYPQGIKVRAKHRKQLSIWNKEKSNFDWTLGMACNHLIAPHKTFDPWLWIRNNNVEIYDEATVNYIPVDGAKRLKVFMDQVGHPLDSCAQNNPDFATQNSVLYDLENSSDLGGFRVNKDTFDEHYRKIFQQFQESKKYGTKKPSLDKYRKKEKFDEAFVLYTNQFRDFLKYEYKNKLKTKEYVDCQ
ncbi:MAG: hypothetical protein KA715_00920 [Xanthomonadaceae bacterium]|nr:hypothetical protein [Xanthomonadaceae bacterium]